MAIVDIAAHYFSNTFLGTFKAFVPFIATRIEG